MVNYQFGKIYKIECNVTGLVYIGSTCEPSLAKRLTKHVGNYKSYLNGKGRYVTSFKIIENGNYDICLLEKYPCDSKDELLSRERYWTQKIECINKIKQQGLLNELGRQEYDKQHRNDNKEHYQEYHKQYRDDNKEYYQEHSKKYYINNKEKIQKKKKEKYICICGGCYTYQKKVRHERSNQHQEYLEFQKYRIILEGLRMIKVLNNHFNRTI
jgi:hypothetical protein